MGVQGVGVGGGSAREVERWEEERVREGWIDLARPERGWTRGSLVHPGGSKLAPLHQNFQILCKPSFETTTLTQRNVLKEDMLSGCKYLNPKAGRETNKEVRKLRPIA